MSAAPPALEVRGIRRVFGGLVAVDDVSFHIQEAEVVGLIGPNGAGKSTLFEMIGGDLRPNSGSVRYFGQDVTTWRPHVRRRAGLARSFQKVRLFESLTVAENVAVAAGECCRPGVNVQASVNTVLQQMRLTTLRHRLPREITLADRKRVEIARALAGYCRVLMLDESLSGLTNEEADELVQEILSLNREAGITIIVVEHVMPVVMAMAQRLLVLQYGKLIADGSPDETVRNPAVIEAYLGTKA